MDILSFMLDVFKFFHLNDAANAGGWVVAGLVTAFMTWRLLSVEKKNEEFVKKLTEVIEKQEDEWRALVRKTDDMTFEILNDTTKTMTVLAEKINTLQLLLLQKGNNK